MRVKKYTSLVLFVLLLFAGTSYTYGSYSSNHVLGGKNTNGGVFKYWNDSSVTSYGYGPKISNSASNWNNVPNAGILLYQTSEGAIHQPPLE